MATAAKVYQPKLFFRLRTSDAEFLYYVIPTVLVAVGLLSVDPALWYDSLVKTSVVVVGGTLLLSAVWELLAPALASPATRIQLEKTAPPQYLKEIWATCVSFSATSPGLLPG
jgi:hypothetical protein